MDLKKLYSYLRSQTRAHIKTDKPNIDNIYNFNKDTSLKEMDTNIDKAHKFDKGTSIKEMHTFAERYAQKTNTFFCLDPSITSVIIAGLADYKEKYELPLCPCRNFRSEEAEIELNFWVCPCVAMRERKECHCNLFVTANDSEASERQKIPLLTVYHNLISNLYN